MLQTELQQVLVTQKDLDAYLYLHFVNNDAIAFGRDFSSHSSNSRFHDDTSMSTTYWKSFPNMSMISWYASLFSDKIKALPDCGNLVNLKVACVDNIKLSFDNTN